MRQGENPLKKASDDKLLELTGEILREMTTRKGLSWVITVMEDFIADLKSLRGH